MKVVVIGLGGIGSHLIRPLCRYLHSLNEEVSVTLIDGDTFEPKNEARQEFGGLGNKAEVIAAELAGKYPRIEIVGKPWYVSAENAYLAIDDGDIVLLCVDNHATRKLVSDRSGELENVVLISGGNEFSDGNVQFFLRVDGENITPPLTHFHPEIESPEDKNPSEMSCEELAASGSPQLIITNFLASAWMLSVFWRYLVWVKEKKQLVYTEIYFDGVTGNARAVKRG